MTSRWRISGVVKLATKLRFLAALLPLAACAQLTSEELVQPDVQLVQVGEPPVRLAVREVGRGAPILMVHGLGTHSYTWRYLVPQLAARHRVITVDLMGFGASDKPQDGEYTFARQAALLQELIEKKDLRDLTLLGHSYGGGLSLLVALNMTKAGNKRLRRLVLFDSLAYPQETPLFFKIVQTPVLGDISATLIPAEWEISAGLKLAYSDKSKVTDEMVREYSRPLQSPGGKHALLQTIRNIVPDNIEVIARQYPIIKVPTLVLWCDEDRVVPLEMGTRLARNLPDAQFKVISGCGHFPQEEKPAEALLALKAHLRR